MRLSYLFPLFIICILFCQGCDNGITYAEQKEIEKDAIQAWITKHDYKIISEEQFLKQDTITNENEFVFFKENGIYMNIISRGKGKKVLSDGRYTMVSRYIEIALSDVKDTFVAGDTLSGNMNLKHYPIFGNPKWSLDQYMAYPDDYILTIDGSLYKAAFKEMSMMAYIYKNSTVPSGWLMPLKYIKPAKTIPVLPSEDIARVKLIVPHEQGSIQASQKVYPCLYEITYSVF
ncbi:MAG: DUF4827 domain-containing protein [Phocaeicola sp.]|nr:DUF4827 domain-containing protein [Phocaeicola sp.]